MGRIKLHKRTKRERSAYLEGWLAGFDANAVAKPEKREQFREVVTRELAAMREKRARRVVA